MFGADERTRTFTPSRALASHASVAAVTPHPQILLEKSVVNLPLAKISS